MLAVDGTGDLCQRDGAVCEADACLGGAQEGWRLQVDARGAHHLEGQLSLGIGVGEIGDAVVAQAPGEGQQDLLGGACVRLRSGSRCGHDPAARLLGGLELRREPDRSRDGLTDSDAVPAGRRPDLRVWEVADAVFAYAGRVPERLAGGISR